jgi:hypothetical protein
MMSEHYVQRHVSIKIDQVEDTSGCLCCDFNTADCCGAPSLSGDLDCGGDSRLVVVEILDRVRGRE